MSTPTDTVQVKAAMVRPLETTGDWFNDKVELVLATQDGVDITFELSVIALIALELSLGPTIHTIKERAERQGNDPNEEGK